MPVEEMDDSDCWLIHFFYNYGLFPAGV